MDKNLAWKLGCTTLGAFSLGYLLGKGFGKSTPIVLKSYQEGSDPILDYCLKHSTPLEETQKKLMKETLKLEKGAMLGAPEVISLNAALIQALGAKKVIDVGVFTGASSLGAALALPDDGRVVACDITDEYLGLMENVKCTS